MTPLATLLGLDESRRAALKDALQAPCTPEKAAAQRETVRHVIDTLTRSPHARI